MKCRLCDSDRLSLYYTQGNSGEFRFYRCPACKLVNYDLSGGIDQEKYAQEYVDPFDETITSNRAQTLTHHFLKAHVRGPGRMLEIGCGNGRLLHLAREDGWTVRAIPVSGRIREATTGYRGRGGELPRVPEGGQ